MKTSVPNLRVPLDAEIELGDNWADVKEVSEWLSLRDNKDEKWKNASNELKQAIFICEELKKEGVK